MFQRWVGLVLVASFLAAVPAFGDDDAPPAALKFGLDTRVREVTLHNLLDFDDDTKTPPVSDAHFFRVRHRVWSRLDLRAGLSLYARFTTEWRKYLDPYLSPAKTEIILDNFYCDVPKLPGLPFSLRIGRQDLIRGEGFVLLEGGPNDGSRSIYQNAILLSGAGDVFGFRGAKFDLFAIRNLVKDEFVIANDQEKWLTNEDETAFGLYVTHSDLFSGKNEAYYIYKRADRVAEGPGCNRRLHTLGTRVTGELPWNLTFGMEGAWQFGAHDSSHSEEKCADHQAYGGYAWVSRSFLTLLRPTIRLGGFTLSGDDPDTEDYEGWDPIFSRWPKWSELYIYTQIAETGRVAYWTNTSAFQAQLALELSGRTKLAYTYYRLHAPQAPIGGCTDRGDLHEWKLSSKFSDSVSGHFLVERLWPGDFYNEPQDDAYFIRWELMVKQ